MFCNHCGGQLQPGQSFCASCGKPVVSPVPSTPAAPLRTRLARHLSPLAIFWIVISVFRLIGSGAILMVGNMRFFGMGPFWGPHHFIPAILSTIGGFMLIGAIAGFAAGWGLLQHRPWARLLALILGALSLLDPPIGTILGIYTLWVLLPAEAEQEYRSIPGAI